MMKARQLVATAVLGFTAIGLSGLVTAGKPDKPRGKTENVPGSITINTPDEGPGLVGDGYFSPYFDWQALGSPDCVRLVVPSSDGVDQGRVTMFHRGPFDECDGGQRTNRSFGVAGAAYDFNGSGGSPELTETGLRGQFRCWAIFADDHSGAYCQFLIMNDVGDVQWKILWPGVTVLGSGDVLTVQDNGDAEVYEVVEVAVRNGGKVKTESQFRSNESIPLDFTVERLSY